ncbi:unnamed protein product [Brassica oleracea]
MNCLKTIALSLSLFLVGLVGPIQAQLQMNFYANTCPNAEKIVQDFVSNHISNAPSLAAALLRKHFHDCFVRGCDGSVLINSSTSGNAERDATPNLTVRGFGFMEAIKTVLEAQCPGIVSCADIIALASRDAVVFTISIIHIHKTLLYITICLLFPIISFVML